MPTTTPDAIYFADSSTSMSAEAISAAEATSVQNAFDAFREFRQIQTFVWADSGARGSQAGMSEGDMGYQLDTDMYYYYSGSVWFASLAGTTTVIPTSVTNGSFTAQGKVTSTAQPLVRVRDAFPNALTQFRITYDITTASAALLYARLAVAATDAATAYDNQVQSVTGATVAGAQSLNQTQIILSGIALAGARHVGMMTAFQPNVAIATMLKADTLTTANPMVATAGKYVSDVLHRTTTAYDSISFFGSTGNITINDLRVEAIGAIA